MRANLRTGGAALGCVLVTLACACGATYSGGPASSEDAGLPDTGSAVPDAAMPPADAGDGGTAETDADSSVDAGPSCLGDQNRALCAAASCPAALCLAPSHVPSSFGTWSRDAGLQVLTLSGSVTLDTTTGAAGSWRTANTNPAVYEVRGGIGFVRFAQGGGEPPIALWVFNSVTFGTGTITVAGTAASVLASAHDLSVGAGAVFDLSGKGGTAGAGGFVGGKYGLNGTGCGPGLGSTTGGAGGGAFGTDGKGGGAGAGGAGAAGGTAAGCAATLDLVALRGGSGGGGADDSNSTIAIPLGGAGGGALQLTALGALAFDGRVNAGGGGGRTPEGNFRLGAGGGSGGAIFLESPQITVGATAGLYANGGGGGSNSSGTGTPCGGTPVVAEDGKASLVVASGGHCGTAFGGNGGAGATASTTGGTSGFNGGGGGGGGHGRIVLRTLPGVTPTEASTNVSPASGSAAHRVLQTLGQ